MTLLLIPCSVPQVILICLSVPFSLRGGWWKTFPNDVEASWGSSASEAAWVLEMPPWSEFLLLSDMYSFNECASALTLNKVQLVLFLFTFSLCVFEWLYLNFNRLVLLHSHGIYLGTLLFNLVYFYIRPYTHIHTQTQQTKENPGGGFDLILWWLRLKMYIIEYKLFSKMWNTKIPQGTVDNLVNWLFSCSCSVAFYLFKEVAVKIPILSPHCSSVS